MKKMDYLFRKMVDWIFKYKSYGLIIFKSGIWITGISLLGGFALNFSYEGTEQSFSLLAQSSDSGLALIQQIGFFLGLFLVIVGIVWLALNELGEYRINSKRKVVVIEQRGLKDTSDSPLANALPKTLKGFRDKLLCDIRKYIQKGVVTGPEEALNEVVHLERDIQAKVAGFDKSDLTLVYGGLMPVPYTFLTGMVFDDEIRLVAYDWDRTQEVWRALEDEDDGKRFQCTLANLGEQKEAVLCISASYQVDLENVNKVFSGMPISHMQLETISSDCHWSIEKQSALASQFLECVKGISSKGVQTIHLIIAAPNSLVLRLGRAYDSRNLCKVIVYQYEKSNEPAYPWGVQMPTHGITHPFITAACSE